MGQDERLRVRRLRPIPTDLIEAFEEAHTAGAKSTSREAVEEVMRRENHVTKFDVVGFENDPKGFLELHRSVTTD
jgi:hypothetical protein